MKLRTRIAWSMAAALTLIGACVYVLGLPAVREGFVRVEEEEVREAISRSQRALVYSAEDLGVKLSDWASWDDAYAFIEDHNEAFIATNMNSGSLGMLRIDAMVFLNLKGEVVSAASAHTESKDLNQISPALARLVAERDSVLEHESETSVKGGLMRLGDQIAVVASRPILTSHSEGPIRGTMVFVKMASGEFIAQLGERLHARFTLTPVEADGQPDRHPSIRVEGPDRISASIVLADIHGRPLCRLDQSQGRPVHREAERVIGFFAAALVAAAGIAMVTCTWTMGRIVVARLARMHRQIRRIEKSGDLSLRVSQAGPRDELGELAVSLNQMVESAQRARAELARASSAKSRFVSHLSHEIRTPMTAILGYADLLCEGDGGLGAEGRKQAVQAIRRNSRHLLALVNDVLDMSKIEAGKMRVEHAPCSVRQIVAEVVSLLSGRAAEAGVELRVQTDAGVPEWVMTDPLRLRQILVNLAGNAVKFTKRGSVTLRVAYEPAPAPPAPPAPPALPALPDRLKIEVEDTGVGMSPEQTARLFTEFAQADESVSRQFGGTGLGLSISRTLARLLGGDISVASREGVGTTFTLTLLAPQTVPLPIRRGPGDEDRLAGRILLAEDSLDSQRLIRFVLERAGAGVHVVGDGREAVAAFQHAIGTGQAFDLVLMDIQMPVMDGLEATRILRAMGVATPILALTAHALAKDRERCLQAGCDEHAAKPIDRQGLIQTCRRLIAGNPARARAAA